MNHSSPLIYLGLGAAIATGALLLMSQAVPPTTSQSAGSWGPPKKNVVNLFEDFCIGGNCNSITIPPNGEHSVYTVPPDRWLTVTECTGNIGVPGAGGTNYSQFWGELLNGQITLKGQVGFANGNLARTVPFSPSTEVGWVFRPGSQVVIKNVPTGSSGQSSLYGYALIGYLTRE